MDILTAKDVAQMLNLNVQRIYELTRQNAIPVIVLGQRQYRYSRQAIQNWAAKGGGVAKESEGLRHATK